jgi:hypothetical protein
MNSKKSLEYIKKFVEIKAEKKFSNYLNNKDIVRVRKILEERNEKEEKKFTFTIGDVNAYLG